MIISTLGGRRFLLCAGCGLVTSLLCWFAKITGEIYAAVIIATVGGYITGNTWQKVKGNSDAGG
jgi:hypothetical protein